MTTAPVLDPMPTTLQRLGRTMADKPVIALAVVLVILYLATAAQDPSLFTTQGFRSILLLACPLAILAAAQTICMLTGGIDLSVSMIANFAAYVAANQAGLGTLPALGLALGVGAGVGLLNGIGVGVFRVHSLIMTLGMSSILVGVVTIGIVGDGFLSGSTSLLPFVSKVGSGNLIGPIPLNTVVLALVVVAMVFLLRRTGLGRTIYALGDNEPAVRLAGVRTWQVQIAVYVIAGVLSAVAGIMFSGISGSVGPDQTNGYLLPAVAAAVIGGTSILGGVGGISGTIVGAFILTVLNRLLLGLDTTEAVRQVIYGLIVLALAWVYVRITGQRAD